MMSANQCPICGEAAERREVFERDVFRVICPRCGEFLITEECWRNLECEQKPFHLVSGWIREENERHEIPEITWKKFEELSRFCREPSPEEKEIRLLCTLVKWSREMGDVLKLTDTRWSALVAYGWCRSLKEAAYLLEGLSRNGLLEIRSSGIIKPLYVPTAVVVTPEGWKVIQQLEREKEKKRPGFIPPEGKN